MEIGAAELGDGGGGVHTPLLRGQVRPHSFHCSRVSFGSLLTPHVSPPSSSPTSCVSSSYMNDLEKWNILFPGILFLLWLISETSFLLLLLLLCLIIALLRYNSDAIKFTFKMYTCVRRSGISGSNGNSVFNILRNC